MEQLQIFCFPNESNENEHSIRLFVGPLLGSTGAVTILYSLLTPPFLFPLRSGQSAWCSLDKNYNPFF